MRIRPHLALDSYKVGHKPQYPDGTELVYSNFTPRSAVHANMPEGFDGKVVNFGLQGMIMDFFIGTWNREFFQRDRDTVVAEYQRRMDTFLGKGAVDCSHIGELHDLGYLPLRIKAIPEGERVNIKVPLFTVVNTLPQFFWLTNYVETIMSNEGWKSITIATIAYEYRRILNKYVELTGSDKGFADFQIHDFSLRGLNGVQSGAKDGAAHLVAAGYGTDTLPAIDYLEDFYGANAETELIGCSVPATEHSVMCMGGMDTEIETYRRLITEVYPTGIVSIVSDTWDFWDVVTVKVPSLKDVILARKPNALGQSKVVIRPDSGDPADIICGSAKVVDLADCVDLEDAKDWAAEILVDEVRSETDHGEHGAMNNSGFFRYDGIIYQARVEIEWNRHDKQYYYIDDSKLVSFVPAQLTPSEKGAVECLWEVFGGTTNDKGYRTLDSHIGLIYGDSITLARCEDILKRLMEKGFAADNIIFGVGSFTYQYLTRDTFGMAMKATYGVVNGVPRELEKDPKTGDGVKKSAKGLLRVEKEGDNFVLYDQQTPEQEQQGILQVVFEDGVMYNRTTLSEIRSKLKQ
jgi:nicotinamide phosphoribosyltransferase